MIEHYTHPLTYFERYIKGLNILNRYSANARVWANNDGIGTDDVGVSLTTYAEPCAVDMETLTYLGWSKKGSWTPFVKDKDLMEIHFKFNTTQTFWREKK